MSLGKSKKKYTSVFQKKKGWDTDMALLEEWKKIVYNEKTNKGELERLWNRYFKLEQGVYEKLLVNPDEEVVGTVKELADKYDLTILEMTGFLDGINVSL